MSAAEAKFNSDGYIHRTRLYDQLGDCKGEFKGHANFSAYRQGRDPQYLGVNGKNYYAKPWGHDSSNVQALLNAPAYWKRVYYRENCAAAFARADAEQEAKEEAAANKQRGGSPGGIKKSASEPNMKKLPAELPDGYAAIKKNIEPLVQSQGKPRIRALETGERLNFHNTLGNKYHMKAGGKNLAWNVQKETHRSTKTELNWILSNYFRTDTQAVLSGAGSETSLTKTA